MFTYIPNLDSSIFFQSKLNSSGFASLGFINQPEWVYSLMDTLRAAFPSNQWPI